MPLFRPWEIRAVFKTLVSRICQDIDEQVQAFLSRPLQETGYAYVYLDTTYYLKGRQGLKVCDGESEGFWRALG